MQQIDDAISSYLVKKFYGLNAKGSLPCSHQPTSRLIKDSIEGLGCV
jgi:hypothetical protein